MKLRAIFAIVRSKDSDPSEVAPGVEFEATEDEAAQLLPMGAAVVVAEDSDEQADLFEPTPEPEPEPEPEPTVETEPTVDRAALEARAAELGVKFRSNTSDETLLTRIAEAENAAHITEEEGLL